MSAPILPNSRITYKRVAGANPGAGVELSDAVPVGKFWLLLSYCVALVQGITQTPQPILIIDDGTNTLYEEFGSSAAQATSTTCVYTWAPGNQISGQVGSGANVHSVSSLPTDLPLLPGYRIRSNTIGIGANSDYGVPSIWVAEVDLS